VVIGGGYTEFAGFPVVLKDRLGDQMGGSEWELIKILLER
jgi:hypothetical protein